VKFLQQSISLNEIKNQFEEYQPDGDGRIILDALRHASEYYDIEFTSKESYWHGNKLSFHDFYRWYTEKPSTRSCVNPRIQSLNVLQRRFNDRVDPEEPLLAYGQITTDAAIDLCRFFAEDIKICDFPNEYQVGKGYVSFHEFVRAVLEEKGQSPLWHLVLNDLKLLFEECDRDGMGKLTLSQFEEIAHMMELPLQSFTDAKFAQNGLTFSAFITWILSSKPELVPNVAGTSRRRYNNHLPNFNSLRKRFNQIDEVSGFLTVEKAHLLFRFFDIDAVKIAEARSIFLQQQEGVAEEELAPEDFKHATEAFTYLLPPPFVDEEGNSHPLTLSFQDFCHMLMQPNDVYFEVSLLKFHI
jgi:hypothetical protein